MDRVLHAARVDPGTRSQRAVHHPVAGLPDGAMIGLPDDPGGAWLVLGGTLRRWALPGYGDTRPRPAGGEVRLLTPLPSVTALAAGYRPTLHPSALHPSADTQAP